MDYALNVSRPFEPKLPPGAMQTFEIDAPLATHWRSATCAEVECAPYMRGWTTDVLPNSAEEVRVKKVYDNEIRRGAITTTVTPEGFTRYHFPAGTACFRRVFHRLPLERAGIFTVRSGDWRATAGVIRTFSNGEEWVDAFANHQDKIKKQIDRG